MFIVVPYSLDVIVKLISAFFQACEYHFLICIWYRIIVIVHCPANSKFKCGNHNRCLLGGKKKIRRRTTIHRIQEEPECSDPEWPKGETSRCGPTSRRGEILPDKTLPGGLQPADRSSYSPYPVLELIAKCTYSSSVANAWVCFKMGFFFIIHKTNASLLKTNFLPRVKKEN